MKTETQEEKTIRVTCTGAGTMEMDKLLEFQGNLKVLTKESLGKLKRAILKYGFTAPVFVWKKGRKARILDGHQRLKAVKALQEEGYIVPLLPVDFIEAADEAEAKAKLLHLTSQYGEFTVEGFEEFVEGEEIDFADIKLAGLDLGKLGLEVEDYSEFEAEMESLEGFEDGKLELVIPVKYIDKVVRKLTENNPKTATGMGRGVLKLCGLL